LVSTVAAADAAAAIGLLVAGDKSERFEVFDFIELGFVLEHSLVCCRLLVAIQVYLLM